MEVVDKINLFCGLLLAGLLWETADIANWREDEDNLALPMETHRRTHSVRLDTR